MAVEEIAGNISVTLANIEAVLGGEEEIEEEESLEEQIKRILQESLMELGLPIPEDGGDMLSSLVSSLVENMEDPGTMLAPVIEKLGSPEDEESPVGVIVGGMKETVDTYVEEEVKESFNLFVEEEVKQGINLFVEEESKVQIKETGNEVLEEIKGTGSETLNGIKQDGSRVLDNIQRESGSGLDRIKSATDGALSSIEGRKNDALNAIHRFASYYEYN